MATCDVNILKTALGIQQTGPRTVIVPADPIIWDAGTSYEYLTIVASTDFGQAYISKRDVPAGTPLTNTEYWIPAATFNAQLAAIQKQLSAIVGQVENPVKVFSTTAEMVGSEALSIGQTCYAGGYDGGFFTISESGTPLPFECLALDNGKYASRVFTTSPSVQPCSFDTVKAMSKVAMSYVLNNQSLAYGWGGYDYSLKSGTQNLTSCSQIANLVLAGVPYEQSPYALGSSTTIKTGYAGYGYDWYEGTHQAIDGNAMWNASLVALWFATHGYGYKPLSDFSNVKPGDVLFYTNGGENTNNWFMNISHCEVYLCPRQTGQTPKDSRVLVINGGVDNQGTNNDWPVRINARQLPNDSTLQLVYCGRLPIGNAADAQSGTKLGLLTNNNTLTRPITPADTTYIVMGVAFECMSTSATTARVTFNNGDDVVANQVDIPGDGKWHRYWCAKKSLMM